MEKRGTIKNILNELKENDIYSLILFALWEIRKIPEYSTLSELSYILDNDSLLRFLDYYGGTTIEVPTKEELKLVIDSLLLYQYVNIEGVEYDEAIKQLDSNSNIKYSKDLKSLYLELCSILNEYDFRRD